MNKYMEHLSELLSEGLEKYSCSEQYKNLLSVMSKFHSYSANNCLLIALQCPEASYIAGYNKWRSDFHRQVKKGAKAIQIKAPMTYKDKETDEERLGFKATYVFNVDDTYQIPSKPVVPLGIDELQGTVNDFKELISCLTSSSPVPVEFKNFKKSAYGYYSKSEGKIVVKDNLSELQTTKTLIHELAHSLLHSDDAEKKSREVKELEAESVAFVVCKYLSLDTDDYSFPYILSWSGDEFKEILKESLAEIQKTADKIIEDYVHYMKK